MTGVFPVFLIPTFRYIHIYPYMFNFCRHLQSTSSPFHFFPAFSINYHHQRPPIHHLTRCKTSCYLLYLPPQPPLPPFPLTFFPTTNKQASRRVFYNHKTYPRTKLEALNAVVKDLKTSVNKGIQIDAHTFCSIFETCYNLQGIQYVVRIHRIIPQSLLRRNVGISSKLIRMYAVSGLVYEAHQVFDKMCQRDVYAFPWNSLISGYAELGQFDAALALYFQMVEDGVEPDGFTFPRVLKACGGIARAST